MKLNRLTTGWRAHIVAVISGALLPLSLAPWDFWPVAIASCALLATLLYKQTAQQCFWRSFWFAFGVFGVGTSWVYVSIHHYGHAPVPLALLLTGLFVALMATITAVPFTLQGLAIKGSRFNTSSAMMLVTFPAIWALNEWWRSWILTGFPWLWLGYGHLDSPLTGLIPITGALGIGWVIALCGATVFSLFNSAKKTPALISTAVLGVLFAGGITFKNHQWTEPTGESINVGMVQPAVPQLQRWNPNFLDSIITNNLQLTEPLWDNDLIIWPESSIPALMHNVSATLQDIDLQGKSTNTTLIAGIPRYDFVNQHYYNQVLQIGSSHGNYTKQHLVPFGEFLPFESLLRGLIDFFDLPMSTFVSGSVDQPALEVNGHKIGTAICYEIIYPELVRQVSADAEVLLTVSNDTWFGGSLGPLQHMEMAQTRALELNKPLMRATNDGITAFVDSQGHIQSQLPQFKQGVLSGKIYLFQGETPFAKFGQWPILLLSFMALLTAGFRYSKRAESD